MPNPKQSRVFDHEDLPLFSGTPQTVNDPHFKPEEAAGQPRLPGIPRPTWDELGKAKKSAR